MVPCRVLLPKLYQSANAPLAAAMIDKAVGRGKAAPSSTARAVSGGVHHYLSLSLNLPCTHSDHVYCPSAGPETCDRRGAMPCPPALTPSLLCHTPPPYPRLLQAALGQAKAPALPTVTTAPSALPADTTASVGSGGPSSASTTAPLRPRVVPLLETSTFAKESLRGLNSSRLRLPRLGGAQTAQAAGLGSASPRAFLPSAPGTPTRAQRVLKFLKDAPYMGETPL
jgi:hypothetical protein